jgi:hypothetical protein
MACLGGPLVCQLDVSDQAVGQGFTAFPFLLPGRDLSDLIRSNVCLVRFLTLLDKVRPITQLSKQLLDKEQE